MMGLTFRKQKLREDFGPADERREKMSGYRPRSFKEMRHIADMAAAPKNRVETLVDPVIEHD